MENKRELVGVINFGYNEETDQCDTKISTDYLLDWETERDGQSWMWSPLDAGFALLFREVKGKKEVQ